MFAIRFLSGLTDDGAAAGELVVGTETEGFHAGLSFWAKADYEHQWQRSLAPLVRAEATTACLVTSIPPLENANFVFWWVLYREGAEVIFQQQILFLEELEEPFDPERPERSIRPRTTASDDGGEVSEWRVSVEAIREFLSSSSRG